MNWAVAVVRGCSRLCLARLRPSHEEGKGGDVANVGRPFLVASADVAHFDHLTYDVAAIL